MSDQTEFLLQYIKNIKQTSDKNEEKYHNVVHYQTPQTNIICMADSKENYK